MRGSDQRTGELFSYVDPEARVRADHPLRLIRAVANEALESMSGDLAVLYAGIGRPSIAPEKLLRAMLLQAFYGLRSFGAMQAGLDIDYGPDEIGFTWSGFDEMDEVTGSGSAELQDDGSLQIEFEYYNGDETVLKAVREPPSTAC